MLNPLKFARMTQKCAARRTMTVPLCSAAACDNPNCTLDGNLNKWFVQQHDQLLKSPSFSYAKNAAKQMPNMRFGSKIAVDHQTDLFHGIASEHLAVLNRYKNMEPVTERVVRPEVGDTCNYQPITVDLAIPSLATYLRSVMENKYGGLVNQIYGINFYDASSPQNEDTKYLQSFLDPYKIGYILDILQRGGNLTQQQWDYLSNFLKAAALMDPQELYDYMKMLHAAGLLSANVLMMLRNQLNLISGQLTESQMNKLLEAFKEVARLPTSVFDPQGIEYLIHILQKGGILTKKQWDYLMDALKNMAERSAYDFLKYLDKLLAIKAVSSDVANMFRNWLVQQGMQPKTQRTKVTNEPKTKEPINFPEIPEPLATQRKKPAVETPIQKKKEYMPSQSNDGLLKYYKPWDADLSWPETRSLVRRSTYWRMNRLDLEQFNYRRGIEKYEADFQRHGKEDNQRNSIDDSTEKEEVRDEIDGQDATDKDTSNEDGKHVESTAKKQWRHERRISLSATKKRKSFTRRGSTRTSLKS